MSAEREPLECHRTILVSPVLEEEGLSVGHIHADGRLEALLRQDEHVALDIESVDEGEAP